MKNPVFLLCYVFLVAIPSHAEQYMCGGDFDGDGYADHQGEVIQCLKIKYCPSTGAGCASDQDCTIYGSCSPYDTHEYECPEDGSKYFTMAQCEGQCAGSCVELPITRYKCSTDGTQSPTMADCENSCPDKTEACEVKWECPFGGSYPCVDIDNPANVNLTQADMRYLRDDGARTADGCDSEVYVLNGMPGECRMDGYRTNYNNCCERAVQSQAAECDPDSIQQGDGWTNVARGFGECHGLGYYCKESWRYIGCVQRGEVYCCFSSLGLGRILHEEGRPTLKSFGPSGDWGSALSPNCRGFTSAEFQFLDTREIDISEFLDRYLNSDASWIDGMKPWDSVRQELRDAIIGAGQ